MSLAYETTTLTLFYDGSFERDVTELFNTTDEDFGSKSREYFTQLRELIRRNAGLDVSQWKRLPVERYLAK